METLDLPCDFTEFLARRGGLSLVQAEERLATWLEHYQPLVRRFSSIATEDDNAREPARVSICA